MKEFEKTIILTLLSEAELFDVELPESKENIDIEYTGVGYFLEFSNASIPVKRIVLDRPNISGNLGGTTVGFLAFIEGSKFTLECHSYEESISQDCREYEFVQNVI